MSDTVLVAPAGSKTRREGLRVILKDLTYSVENRAKKGESLKLLGNVSAFFEPNQMSALMGPSGSGKTTLLDLLAGRKTVGKTEGDILFGGVPPTKEFLRRYTGYVEQFDTLLDMLTVKEMLMYTAELKRPLSEPYKSKEAAVDDLLEELALNTCRNVLIGNYLNRGISGGQAKRTNIGIALITNPRLLFLDEPTTGLDSYTSNEVMTLVQKLAHNGTTIIATIHSPTAYSFNLFERLLVLARGLTIYSGPRSDTSLEKFINQLPQKGEMPVGYHWGEWLVDVITESDREGRVEDLHQRYLQSDLCKENDAALSSYHEMKADISPDLQKELQVERATVTPWWWAVLTMLKYRTKNNLKNPEFLGPRIGDKVVISFLLVTLYWGVAVGHKGKNLTNLSAVLYFWLASPAFAAAAYVPAIMLERALFYRERADGLYVTGTYLAAKLVEEYLLALVVLVIPDIVMWFALGLHGNWFTWFFVHWLASCAGIAMAYAITAACPNMDVANAAVPVWGVFHLFFGGFFIRYGSMPAYWRWFSYIDFVRYAWGAGMVNEFEKVDHQLKYIGGKSVLTSYGLQDVDKHSYAAIILLFVAGYIVLGLAALAYIKHQKR